MKNKEVSLKDIFQIFLKIGFLSFGGPTGQIALMHEEIVDKKQWIDNDSFLHALNFCNFLPGPEAQQLATYIGWKKQGIRGGLLAGLLFIIPGSLVMFGLTLAYIKAAHLQWVNALFFGIKAAVIAIIIAAILRISQKTLKNNFQILTAIFAFCAIFFFNLPFPLIISLAALFGFFMRGKGIVAKIEINKKLLNQSIKTATIFIAIWFLPFLIIFLTLGKNNVYFDIFTFFSRLAVTTFGGAYAVLSYMAQEAVNNYGWLKPFEMADGLGLAETTPGPLILVTQFVGMIGAYREPSPFSPIIGMSLAAILTLWATFVPCFLWIFTFAPFIESFEKISWLKSSLSYISAAIVGIIANLGLWFALHFLFNKILDLQIGLLYLQIPAFSSLNYIALIISILAIIINIKAKPNIFILLGSCALFGLIFYFI